MCNGSLKVVKCLIENGANINIRDNNGQTPLYHAADEDKFEIVKYLIDFGAWIDLKNTVNNYTPLHAAVEEGHQNVVKFLIENGANVNICNKDFQSPLHFAVESVFKYLLWVLLKTMLKSWLNCTKNMSLDCPILTYFK